MATPTQPNLIPEPWAETSGNFDTIPATQQETGRASWDNGFPLENTIPVAEGGTPSHYLDFQGVLNALSSFAWWQQRGGQFTWSSDLEYPVGVFVLGSDGNLYKSIQASTPSDPQDPTTATAYWTIADPTAFLPLSGGTMTGNLYLSGQRRILSDVDNQGVIIGGSNSLAGACLQLMAENASSNAGVFWLFAKDFNNTTTLTGIPGGNLQWGGKNVECIDSQGSGYVRYTNGIQICWGSVNASNSGATVNLPKAYTSATSYSCLATLSNGNATGFTCSVNRSSSSFVLYDSASNAHTYMWMTIGSWS